MSIDFANANIETKSTKVKQSTKSAADLSSVKSEVKKKPSLFDNLLNSTQQNKAAIKEKTIFI